MSNAKVEFTALVADAKLKVAKPVWHGAQPSGGSTTIYLQVDQPEPPRAPSVPYDFSSRGGWSDPPKAPTKKKGMSDEDYEAQEKVVEFRKLETKYRHARETWESEMAIYRRRAEAFMGQLQTYAMLPGIMALFGGQKVTVELTAVNEGMFPGFGLQLQDVEEPPLLDFPDHDDEDDEIPETAVNEPAA